VQWIAADDGVSAANRHSVKDPDSFPAPEST
jgi:hypothetical protein